MYFTKKPDTKPLKPINSDLSLIKSLEQLVHCIETWRFPSLKFTWEQQRRSGGWQA